MTVLYSFARSYDNSIFKFRESVTLSFRQTSCHSFYILPCRAQGFGKTVLTVAL